VSAESLKAREPGLLPEILALRSEPAGARFYRADLQVHTPIDQAFEPKPEPKKPSERLDLARAYLAKAKERGIELVGITEHNDVSWIDELREAAAELEIHLLPGFEVESKEGIHVLCLFDPKTSVSDLEDCLAQLGLTKAKRAQRRLELRADKDFRELIPFVQDQCGGICIAAHIESSKGLLTAIREGARVETWKTPELLAAQLAKPQDQIKSGNGRIVRGEDPNYQRERLPAYLLTSDCRSLDKIGTTSTWIKLGEVSVAGLKQAFLDPPSRIAYEDPAALRKGGRLLGIRWDGGFLDGIGLPINLDLNCLIGGKGTGKSTVIETVRYAFDLDYRTEEVSAAASQLLQYAFKSGSKVSVLIETGPPARMQYLVERTAPHAPVVRDERGNPLPDVTAQALVSPCVYGQKEIFGIAQSAQARLELLDGFAEDALRGVVERERSLVELLRENANLILDARRRIDDAQERLAELPNLEQWRERFKEAGFEELLRERRQLDREERLLAEADGLLVRRLRAIEDFDSSSIAAAIPAGEELVNLDLLDRARSALAAFDDGWTASMDRLRREISDVRDELGQIRKEWTTRRAARSAEFDRALRELQERIPEVDPEQYLDVERRIEQLTPLRSVLAQLQQRLADLQKERARLIINLDDLRGEKHRARSGAAERLNESLEGSVKIELTYQGERGAFVERLAGLRTGARADALRRVVEKDDFTPSRFVQMVRERKLLEAFGLPEGQAAAIERGLSDDTLLELEITELPDRVELLLDVSLGEGRDYRPLARLSPGQKSTAILLLIMQESREPLLIDQPEDDLDNRFIYDDIVRRLRAMKPSRQFLIATHNANIPVLGDAEQIVALDAQERDGGAVAAFVRARGAIDSTDVREAAEQILEGGREAFAFRRAKYGF
jgi:PHP family Zn ribbon phosphoesterase